MSKKDKEIDEWMECRLARDEAIERAHRGAHQEWLALASRFVHQVAEKHAFFSTDEVWAAGLPEPPMRADGKKEKRGLGWVMKEAARDGICESTGRARQTQRKIRHMGYVAEWHSLLFKVPSFDDAEP